ncbi:pyridoxal phosphate-dependent aminotransferase [Mangrovimonas spongiae]|uniref:Aminotransferase n=1 Tax=Mangrovimonas spongiae TaxID=2494697 RepID=A0A3R9M8T3_9FLAO|nr:aminotransferase class I/II-fold pyridoxal phosphate-dependent enzyme [Mangrovimonas spongiae]RSK39916.1 aminotransferase class I/II-fold pyridoxal phosphate-dependent enzyme [Mangrovimonas spongiae]
MITVADRLHTVEEYYFSKKLKEVNFLKSQGKPIINLGIGSPDLNPSERVVSALTENLSKEVAHQYQSYQGLPELRDAIALFYKKQFHVWLSAQTEILPLMGSKEGIMHISMAFLNPGDEVLAPNPGYPTYSSVTKLLGATPIPYNLTENTHWLPDLKALEKTNLSKVKIMWVNYPHMPTGAQADDMFYQALINFAKRHNILLINDNPYSFILNDNPKSILKFEGAKDCCLELNSLSKTFNMAGWRVGMVLGKSEFIQHILKVKSNMDSGMFYGIQKGAIEALNCSNMWYKSLNSVYRKRRNYVWQIANALNCTYNENSTGMFVWAKLPPLVKSEEFVDLLLKEKAIFIAPGTVFGSNGEGYVRFSLCASTEDLEETLARVR